MAQLIDTNIFIELERRKLGLDALIGHVPDAPLALASMTASELLMGVHRANTAKRKASREAFVERILQILPVFPFDLSAARFHAEVGALLRASGKMIGANDLVIAATALANGCSVLTANAREFERVPGLVIRQPTW